VTRIVAGELGGRTLTVPASGTRPTSERVREALFSMLGHRGVLDDARVLDLYAGSGALGLEAVSRGAASAVLVDKDQGAVRVCRANVAALGVRDKVEVVAGPALRHVTSTSSMFDLVVLDPPYAVPDTDLEQVLLALVPVVEVGGTVVVERSSRTEVVWPEGLVAVSDRRYGETRIWIATRA
jgi:16S rRNA (guanine966-N2)-methyltransferase